MNKLEAIKKNLEEVEEALTLRDAGGSVWSGIYIDDIKWLLEVVGEMKPFVSHRADCPVAYTFGTPDCLCGARALLAKINEEEEAPNAKR